ncbi:hypothetical protein [Bacillus sp. FJAT-49736]|uniref:hypothetical protein n=1 Tax=Bacillus sp. FJAT-49736 TaxID=2833582 RepID=UPI001BCA63BE|nr:hypothetical protein [Bacillus sp. FJAT-49736]MBS4172099.1 hypothetical protein [Bacillus sp. FJAT-49736]
MYYESRLTRILNVIRSIAINLQGKNYFFILIPCLLFSGLSLFYNHGFPASQDLKLFLNYGEHPSYFLIDSVAGLLCLIMTIPTSYLWWELRKEHYFYKHLPVLIGAGILFVGGFLFAAGLTLVFCVLIVLYVIVWLWSMLR